MHILFDLSFDCFFTLLFVRLLKKMKCDSQNSELEYFTVGVSSTETNLYYYVVTDHQKLTLHKIARKLRVITNSRS